MVKKDALPKSDQPADAAKGVADQLPVSHKREQARAAALRENLLKRKQQLKQRKTEEDDDHASHA